MHLRIDVITPYSVILSDGSCWPRASNSSGVIPAAFARAPRTVRGSVLHYMQQADQIWRWQTKYTPYDMIVRDGPHGRLRGIMTEEVVVDLTAGRPA